MLSCSERIPLRMDVCGYWCGGTGSQMKCWCMIVGKLVFFISTNVKIWSRGIGEVSSAGAWRPRSQRAWGSSFGPLGWEGLGQPWWESRSSLTELSTYHMLMCLQDCALNLQPQRIVCFGLLSFPCNGFPEEIKDIKMQPGAEAVSGRRLHRLIWCWLVIYEYHRF